MDELISCSRLEGLEDAVLVYAPELVYSWCFYYTSSKPLTIVWDRR
jgi:hypothetical protein